jgi:iron-sulfur cluster assembly protein
MSMTAHNRPPLFKLSEAAAIQVNNLLQARDKPAMGVRIGLRTKGCSGLSYTLEYVDELNPHDETVSEHGVTIYIDPKAVMFLIGTTMDFVGDELQSGFVFNNPNEKGRCGCGESFHV